MQKKLPLFSILKLGSSRIRKAKYRIDLTLSQARQNGEVVSVGDSELLRLLRRMRGDGDDVQTVISRLKRDRKRIKGFPDSPENRKALNEINNKLDEVLFIGDLVVVHFDNVSHYRAVHNGITVNGKTYVRLMAGSGHTRRSSAIFCRKEIHDELWMRLNNGRKPDFEMNMGKFSSYFALVSSATHSVKAPRFAVIKDYETLKAATIDTMVESDRHGIDHNIVEKETSYTKNVFDGQGLVSPYFANVWAEQLGLGYTPSHWVFRGVFLKGGLVTFDFLNFAIESNTFSVTDVWGNKHDVFDLDVILSESQFKLAQGYDKFEDYLMACKENGFGWGISRFSPEKDKNFSRMNYQFIQVLDLDRDDIEELCSPTIDWFEEVMGGDTDSSLLYLLGETANKVPETGWFDRLDTYTKIVVLEKTFVKDRAIRGKILSSLRRKMSDGLIGRLLINGNYQAMISDPVAQIEWALGLPVKGALEEGEVYSSFWVSKDVYRVAALRAPMTWKSEVNVVKVGGQGCRWYENIGSGIVFNIYDDSMARMSGADFDGDMCLTTDSGVVISGASGGNIVGYERKPAEKQIIDPQVSWVADTKSMTNRIGFVTNLGTTYYSMLPLYDKGSPEYRAIINRLKLLFCFQSMEIDKSKGIQTVPLPLYWTKWSKTTGVSPEDYAIAFFNNSILCDKRPYFFRWLYARYDKSYKKHLRTYDNYCWAKFGKSLAEVLSTGGIDPYEKRIVYNYRRFCPLIESESVMNLVAKRMELAVGAVRKSDGDDLLAEVFPVSDDGEKIKGMKVIFDTYLTARRDSHNSEDSLSQIIQNLKASAESGVSSNDDELASLAIHIDVGFAINVFGDEVVGYLTKIFGTKILFPLLSNEGNIKYLGGRYQTVLLEICNHENSSQRNE